MTNGRKVVGGSGPWPRPALAIVLAAFTGACPPKPPKVTAIEIVPSAVEVGSDPTITTTFELEARLWTGDAIDRHSIIEGQGYDNLVWIGGGQSTVADGDQPAGLPGKVLGRSGTHGCNLGSGDRKGGWQDFGARDHFRQAHPVRRR